MTILDKLMEKKDLDIYIKARTRSLQTECKRQMRTAAPKDRGFIQERFVGRIKELKRIQSLLKQGKLKEQAKAEWTPEEIRW